jgi:hypothetical protein
MSTVPDGCSLTTKLGASLGLLRQNDKTKSFTKIQQCYTDVFMLNSDLINSLFEVLGAIMLFNNCRLLWLHKCVQGVSVLTTIFFTLWGIWNLYFYPAHALWLSFAGGLFLASANVLWVVMAGYYSLRSHVRVKQTV